MNCNNDPLAFKVVPSSKLQFYQHLPSRMSFHWRKCNAVPYRLPSTGKKHNPGSNYVSCKTHLTKQHGCSFPTSKADEILKCGQVNCEAKSLHDMWRPIVWKIGTVERDWQNHRSTDRCCQLVISPLMSAIHSVIQQKWMACYSQRCCLPIRTILRLCLLTLVK